MNANKTMGIVLIIVGLSAFLPVVKAVYVALTSIVIPLLLIAVGIWSLIKS